MVLRTAGTRTSSPSSLLLMISTQNLITSRLVHARIGTSSNLVSAHRAAIGWLAEHPSGWLAARLCTSTPSSCRHEGRTSELGVAIPP